MDSVAPVSTTEWYWCLTHSRPEGVADRDDPDNSLGPYPTEDAARNWKQRVDERNATWKAQDEAWEGEATEDDA